MVLDMSASYIEESYEKEARQRSKQNRIIKCVYNLVTSVTFNFSIFCLIIGNTVTLAAYRFDESKEQEDLLSILNDFFTWIFFVEMVLRLIGLGPANYIKDGYNIFDCLIVIISLIDYAINSISTVEEEGDASVFKAFRALRLLRMIKLSRQWKALKEMMGKIMKSMSDISSFSLLLVIFMYIFALLGMELFSCSALLDEDDNLIIGKDKIQELFLSGRPYKVPRDNFDNIGYAMTTIFVVIMGEDWNLTMYQWVRALSFYRNSEN